MIKRTMLLLFTLLLVICVAACSNTQVPAPSVAVVMTPTPSALVEMTPAPSAAVEMIPAPFTAQDIADITSALHTVGDYVQCVSPTAYICNIGGPMSGMNEVVLALRTDDTKGEALGFAMVAFTADGKVLEQIPPGEFDVLPEAILSLEARLVEAWWMSDAYALPTIRGVKVGAAAQDVVQAFFSRNPELPEYTITDLNPAVDETWNIREGALIGAEASTEPGENNTSSLYSYGWCNLNNANEKRTYYSLEYGVRKGSVFSIVFKSSEE